MLSTQLASQGAGQMRPVNSGKLLVDKEGVKRVLPVAHVDVMVELGNHVSQRATSMAEGNGAIHAPPALLTWPCGGLGPALYRVPGSLLTRSAGPATLRRLKRPVSINPVGLPMG